MRNTRSRAKHVSLFFSDPSKNSTHTSLEQQVMPGNKAEIKTPETVLNKELYAVVAMIQRITAAWKLVKKLPI